MNSHLVYHYLAIKYKNHLWRPFIESLAPHLEKLRGPKLLILGGSSCSCLTTSFLEKFSEITIIDPDPLAPFFFKWHHRSIKAKYIRSDAFSFDERNLDALKTKEFLEQIRPDSVLFSNVIGQLPLYYSEFYKNQKHLEWAKNMVFQLLNYSWISFHDTISYFPSKTIDHLTKEQNWPRKNIELSWQITPKQKHTVEVVGS